MSDTSTPPDRTNWAVDYDVAPVRIRDPVAEALGLLPPGEPFVITYRDVVTAAGHSCPTAAGAYRITWEGLEALYPEALPVRSEVAVAAGGPREDPAYGVMGRLVSFVTGAAEEDGFGGLAGGYGGRQGLFTYGDFAGTDPAFEFTRTDTGETVRVTYAVSEAPGLGPAREHLPKILEGSATGAERAAFQGAWRARVRTVLAAEDLFAVTRD